MFLNHLDFTSFYTENQHATLGLARSLHMLGCRRRFFDNYDYSVVTELVGRFGHL